MIRFSVPTRPVGTNHAYKPARWGGRHGLVLTEAGKDFKDTISIAARNFWLAVGRPTFARPEVSLAFFWPTEGGDVDSPIKLVLDALQGTFYANDRAVKDLGRVSRRTDKSNPRIEIEIREAQ